MSKFKFTQDDLDKMILGALKQEPESGETKPNILERLRSKVGLNREWQTGKPQQPKVF